MKSLFHLGIVGSNLAEANFQGDIFLVDSPPFAGLSNTIEDFFCLSLSLSLSMMGLSLTKDTPFFIPS